MKKLFTVACVLTSLFAAPAFAADLAAGNELDNKFSASDLAAADDFGARAEQIGKIVKSGKNVDENVAIVNQITSDGHVSLATITQTGHGNFAVINQDARVNPAVALVFQSGGGARAIVSQR